MSRAEDFLDYFADEEEGLVGADGIDLNPANWIAAAAQGVFTKASTEINEATNQAQAAVAPAPPPEPEPPPKIRLLSRITHISKEDWKDKAKKAALPVGIGLGVLSVVVSLLKR